MTAETLAEVLWDIRLSADGPARIAAGQILAALAARNLAIVPADSLDAGVARVMATLPLGAAFTLAKPAQGVAVWLADAYLGDGSIGGWIEREADTPAAALRALADELERRK